ncbi:MAG: TolC family protein [Bacteroidota bacterium]
MKVINKNVRKAILIIVLGCSFSACKSITIAEKKVNIKAPQKFQNSDDSLNSANLNWKLFFHDVDLISLIDSALVNNQELNSVSQELQIARNEVQARKGEYLPFVGFGTNADVEKVGRYTSKGSSEATTEIKPGKATPEPLPNFNLGFHASWEIDIWHKLRNAKKSAYSKYLGSVEARKFLVTNLVAEISNSYYELLALDNQLRIVEQNVEIQNNALKIVKLEKEATRVTELAVKKFEAEVFYTKSLQFEIKQKIIETENRINFLLGRFPQKVNRNSENFSNYVPDTVFLGLPSHLLENRADIKQAEIFLQASSLDIKVAKAQFLPSVKLNAGLGLQAFNPVFLLKAPESLLYSLAGDLVSPLINRNAIKTAYFNANSKQIQAVYSYEKTILNAFIEVTNQMFNIQNLNESYKLKEQQVQALNQSIEISTNLFKSAKADYMEVLLTQRDALESKFDLIETKMLQMHAEVNLYRALGGGWK